MPTLKVIQPGQSIRDFSVSRGESLGNVFRANRIDAAGKAVVMNGNEATLESVVDTDSVVLLASAVKGGN